MNLIKILLISLMKTKKMIRKVLKAKQLTMSLMQQHVYIQKNLQQILLSIIVIKRKILSLEEKTKKSMNMLQVMTLVKFHSKQWSFLKVFV